MGKALVLAFGAIIAATLLLGPKLNVWIRWLTKRLLRIAIERLPEAQRERFSEEWASHINEVSGEISKFAVALGYIFAAPEMASLLKSREPSRFYRLSRRFLDSKLSGILKRTLDYGSEFPGARLLLARLPDHRHCRQSNVGRADILPATPRRPVWQSRSGF